MDTMQSQIKDTETTVEQLKEIVDLYRTNNDLDSYDTTNDLISAINVEAGELLELITFTEKTPYINHIEQELADVLIYCLALSKYLQIDITSAIQEKIAYNVQRGRKYPINGQKGGNMMCFDEKRKHDVSLVIDCETKNLNEIKTLKQAIDKIGEGVTDIEEIVCNNISATSQQKEKNV